MTQAEWERVSQLASIGAQQRWESSYGCPDCADQGAWTLIISVSGGEIRKTMLDARADQNPESLQLVIDAVRDLRAEVR